MPKGRHLSGALALFAFATPGFAQGTDGDFFKFSGFGTFGAVHSSEKNADFVSTALQPDGAGFSRDTAYSPDKKIGLQANAKLSEMFSVVLQGVSEYRYDRTYNPALTLGFLKCQLLPELSVRAGRVPFPAYIISDYQKTGYAYTWVRPPVEVYQFNPFTSFDGGDITWQQNVGSVGVSVKILGGSFDDKGYGRGAVTDFYFRKMVGMSFTATHGNSIYRAFYTQFDLTATNPVTTAALGQIQKGVPPLGLAANAALADQLAVVGKNTTYISLSYQYDPGNWFIVSEVGRNAGADDLVIHATAAYVTAGFRLGDWTPYLMAAQRKNDSETTHPNPIANVLLLSGNKAQQSFSAGIRWDFMKNFDLKLQFDQIKNDTNAQGTLANPQPTFQRGQSYSLITANLDFIF
jgi:hypothetical protein